MAKRKWAVLVGIFLAGCPCAFALNPALDVSQYAHTAWKIREGFSKGTIFAIAQTTDGYLWLATEFGLLRFDGVRNGSSDGVRIRSAAGGYSPRVSKASDGKLWFLPLDGVSVIDPSHLPLNKLPPPVHIEQITADRKTYDATSDASEHLRLPPLVRDLQIDYTALSLVAPEKVRFRYKLEGRDDDWRDAGNRRQAFYDNLPPGNYRFRVSASNDSGVWNEAGTFLDFAVAPAFYQTGLFRASCLAAFVALFIALYQLRLRQVARQFDIRLEERLGERTRVARELHDTLLQGFISASMQLHVAADFVTPDSPAKPLLSRGLQIMGGVIDDGRNAISGLRSSDIYELNLEQAFSRMMPELDPQKEVGFQIIVEGRPLPLRPAIRDEVYRIGREALVNAFRHSQAKAVEIELEYAASHLRLLVRDNGCGIDPQVVQSGRGGHWGLTGMRERAERIGGRINIWSRHSAGTEVDLSVPGTVAFAVPPSVIQAWRQWLAGKMSVARQSRTEQ
jgi:signal transduction histidine kinase